MWVAGAAKRPVFGVRPASAPVGEKSAGINGGNSTATKVVWLTASNLQESVLPGRRWMLP